MDHSKKQMMCLTASSSLSATGSMALYNMLSCLLRHSSNHCGCACIIAQVAIKQLERPHLVLRYVESELVNHSQLRHPHVVQFREVFLTEQHVSSWAAVQQRHRARDCYT
jgi:D-alanyl-D-alanine dipeptidase